MIGVIPQDPVIFIGTIRSNLDPFNTYSDAQIWKVLKEIQLFQKIKESCEQLDFPISENGNNLSCGEKQLICLGRALLKNPKVLVMDEATANIDKQTDEIVQNVIKENFKESTKIVIAHRLNTIIDADRVIVLDKGQIKEEGNPKDLLNNPNSFFYKIAKIEKFK